MQKAADKENLTWPVVPILIPPKEWQGKEYLPAGLREVYRSRFYLIQVYQIPGKAFPDYARVSVQRSEDAAFRQDKGKHPPISWDALQEIKNQIGFGDRLALEVYPPDSELVNVAPMRHLWISPLWEAAWARL